MASKCDEKIFEKILSRDFFKPKMAETRKFTCLLLLYVEGWMTGKTTAAQCTAATRC